MLAGSINLPPIVDGLIVIQRHVIARAVLVRPKQSPHNLGIASPTRRSRLGARNDMLFSYSLQHDLSICYTHSMLKINFTWDPAKAEKNLIKHDVSFDEVSTIFKDPLALYFDDVEHSQKEKREIVIGRSTTRERLLTCFIARTGDTVNIISARTSTHRERQNYDENAHIKHRAKKNRVPAK